MSANDKTKNERYLNEHNPGDGYPRHGDARREPAVRRNGGRLIKDGRLINGDEINGVETGGENEARPDNAVRSVLTVCAVFIVSLLTLIVFSFSGVEIPYFTVALNGLVDFTAGRGAGGRIADAAGSANASGAEDGADGWSGGVPSELMGSGGAWDGERIRIPSLSVSYDASEETEFRLYGNYLAECSRDSFCLIDKDGAEVFRKSVDVIKPALFVQGEYLLVSDYGGRSAFVMKGAKLVWEDTFTSVIVNASVNKAGYAAFVLDAAGYRNSVKVLAPAGKMLFDWVVAEDYVLGAEIAPSGKELVVNRLKTNGINVCSELEFLDMQSEPFMTINSGDEEVFLSARYLDNNLLAVVTEAAFRLYSERGELLSLQTFDSVMAMCEFPLKKAAVAVRQNNRALVMEYDGDAPKGRVLYIADRPVVNMTADNGCLFINLGHEAAVIKDNGDIVSRLTLDSEVQYGGASDKFGVLVVTKKSADIYAY